MYVSQEQLNDLITLSSYPSLKILEIGFNAGHSYEGFLLASDSSRVLSFDIGLHKYVNDGKEYIDNKFPGRHSLIIGDSRQTIPEFIKNYGDVKFDFIFIDGGHDYDIALSDLTNCYFLAHENTLIIMDDVVYKNEVKEWNIGPNKVWMDFINDGRIIEIGNKDYENGTGMAWGYYVF